MRSLFIGITVLCIVTQGALAATAATGAACNPWTTARCTGGKYYNTGVANAADLAGCGCTAKVGTYQLFSSLSTGTPQDGTVNDYLCDKSCGTPTDTTVAPCDASGVLCAVCSATTASNGKAPTAAAPQLCSCTSTTTGGVTTLSCPNCAHGYYGTDGNGNALTPSDTQGTTDATYYNIYGTTAAAKCVVCPTLTNCAQCASATTCQKCTAASGNTPNSKGSCSAAKIAASVAFVFVGLAALLF